MQKTCTRGSFVHFQLSTQRNQPTRAWRATGGPEAISHGLRDVSGTIARGIQKERRAGALDFCFVVPRASNRSTRSDRTV